MIKIYTDGCCLNNQSKENHGGWAYVAIFEDEQVIKNNGNAINTTNQRMELIAAIEGMMFAISLGEKDIEILTYSAYVCNCVKDGWYLKWLNNGWQNSKNDIVKNKDLWETFIALLEMEPFKFTHVRGHNGDKWNEEADSLAKNAALKAKRNLIKATQYDSSGGYEIFYDHRKDE